MSQTEKMRAFIIKFLYAVIWVGIIYCALKYAMPLLMPFVIAFLIAFMLKPLINKIAEKTFFSRKAAAIVLLVLLYAVVVTLLVLLGAKVTVSLKDLFAELPAFYNNTIVPAVSNMGNSLDDFVFRLDPALLEYLETISETVANGVSSAVSGLSSWAINGLGSLAGSLPWAVVGLVLTIVASFFFVVDYYRITGFITHQLSEKARTRLFVIKDYVVNVLLKFLRAYLILMSITFAEVAVGLLILQVPNPFLIALITAVVDILPVLGTGTIMIPWAVYCLFMGNYWWGIGLLVLYGAITFIRQALEPRVVGGQIGLYPLLTLICMFLGARLFGFWGMLGFPVTLTVLIYLNRTGEISFFKEKPADAPQAGEDGPQPPAPQDGNEKRKAKSGTAKK